MPSSERCLGLPVPRPALPLSLTLLWLATSLGACSKPVGKTDETAPKILTLGAYTTPREVYRALLPVFAKQYRARTGQSLSFRESYLGSGAQARAIANGFEADVAALSLEPDVETLRKAKLITHDYKSGTHAGIVTRSIVVIGVRPGNPKNIRDWSDLAKPGIQVLTPNVRTSGGAMWNVLAVYGAGLRASSSKGEGESRKAATDLLSAVLRNVKVMDRGARESMITFERGVGDAILTYENEMLVGRSKGQHYEYVVPKSTILIENPAAVVDVYAKRHGVAAEAREFVEFLHTPESQRAYAQFGLRPVLPAVADEVKGRFPDVTDLFSVNDLGGWKAVQTSVFDAGKAYDEAMERTRAR